MNAHSTRAVATALSLSLALTAHAEPNERLTLAQAVALASGRHPSVAMARLRAQQAGARITQSRAALLPSATALASMTERTYNLYALGITLPRVPGSAPTPALQGPVYDSEARLRVAQPVFDWASWRRLRATRLGQLGARADVATTSEAAAQAAALAYLRAARADAVARAREGDLALARELQTIAEAQLEAGTSPAIDATRARTQVASSQGALLIARHQRDRARIDLARALGLDPAAAPEPADSLSAELGASGAPTDEPGALAFALEHRDELRGEQARLERARADRSATAGERVPRIDASADWGKSGVHFGSSIHTYTYAVAVSLPILDGFRREGRLSEQGALVREAEVRSRELRDQIAAEVSGALLDLASGHDQQGIASQRLALALEEVEQATERFASGVAGNIELINAQVSLIRARDADIDARFAVAAARVALARATGVARELR